MKSNNRLIYSVIIIFSALIFGCKGDTGLTGPTGPKGPGGPSLLGNISGNVIMIDTDGVQPVNKSGILVQIEGTSKTAYTDSTGKWMIDSVYTEIYTIDFSKAGFGMGKYVK